MWSIMIMWYIRYDHVIHVIINDNEIMWSLIIFLRISGFTNPLLFKGYKLILLYVHTYVIRMHNQMVYSDMMSPWICIYVLIHVCNLLWVKMKWIQLIVTDHLGPTLALCMHIVFIVVIFGVTKSKLNI